MSAIMKIRQARNPEQIAEELEPLAMSLATLADQAQASIRALDEASQKQARAWSSQQESAAYTVQQAAQQVGEQAESLKKATAKLQAAAEEIEQAQRGQLWQLAALLAMAGILGAALATAFVLWLAPTPTVQNRLNPKELAEYLKPAILDALKRR